MKDSSNETDRKNSDFGPPERMENGNPDVAVIDDKQSKNFIKTLMYTPCGDTPKGINYATILIGALLIWALLYILLGHEVELGGQLFELMILTILSHFCGWLVSLLHLPPLLGMLLWGTAQRNLGFYRMTGVYTEIVSTVRQISLVVMLVEAGLGLDPDALKKLSFVVARLAVLPCITETIATAVAAHVLMDMPWLWGVLLGFIVSAVSPAVVVPNIISLKKRGYGESKGISTLVIAASSIDDIICISGFGVCLGMVLSQGDLISNILQGPIECVIGVIVGLGWGFISAYIPHRNEDYVVLKRSFMVGCGGLVAVLGSQLYGFSGSGPLSCIILAFVASLCWKWQGWSKKYNPVSDNFGRVWKICQPLLFGLIGTEIKLSDINAELIGSSAGIFFFGGIIRTVTCCVALFGANLNVKEIIFVNIAWLPKATVQAALGPIALDLAIRTNREDTIPWAQSVLSIAVLSIIATAPLGAIGIAVSGPRLLTVGEPEKTNAKGQQSERPRVGNQIV